MDAIAYKNLRYLARRSGLADGEAGVVPSVHMPTGRGLAAIYCS